MSNETSPTPPNTGQVIAQDIAAADAIITPWITTLNPAIGSALHLALKLLSVAEPAVYTAIASLIQGTPLTPEQDAAIKAAATKLQNPEQYFA